MVIGGGPVGSYLAYRMAAAGYSVVVLEKEKRLRERICCTGIIGQECIDTFGIADDVILRRVNSARLFSPSGKILRLWREKTQAYVVDRVAFDRAMAERAQHVGAEYIFDSHVRNIEVEDDIIKAETDNRVAENFKARVAVIAAGFGSRLVEVSGLGKVGGFVTGAQSRVETAGVDEVEVYFGRDIAPGCFAWLVPTSPNEALAGLLSLRDPGDYLRKFISSRVAEGKIVSADVDIIHGGIQLRPLARTYGNRVITVGGVAGQVKPITGGGIYYGLLCADIAADNLKQALENDDLSAKKLAGYEKGWKIKLGREMKIGYYARKIYERLSDRRVDTVFDIITSRGIDTALLEAEDLSFDWHGEAVIRLLGHGALSQAVKIVKAPFYIGGKI